MSIQKGRTAEKNPSHEYGVNKKQLMPSVPNTQGQEPSMENGGGTGQGNIKNTPMD